MTILAAARPVVRPRLAAPRYVSWQEAMKDAVRDPEELCRLLELPADLATAARKSAHEFPLFVPRGFLARMRAGDFDDPLLRQVLPLAQELDDVPGFVADPVDDAAATRLPGLLQKYQGRALLVTTGACAVHCRYCFRRHFPYAEAPRSIETWQPAIDEIAADASLHEVILSGGDPLTIVDAVLDELVDELAAIPHLRRLRIHTRLPIMIPERVTDQLLKILRGSRLTSIVVVHANHANELDASVGQSLAQFSDAGIVLLNQAVLLRGVNDSLEAQAALCERLADLRVMPYYLHQLDRVAGAAHFEVPIEHGRQIMKQLRARLPGYAVPKYVREAPGALSKVVIE
ncbi:MAG TPA: EF-P beta-lysylation protein EpmB [Lacipirellulaceae bacterium]